MLTFYGRLKVMTSRDIFTYPKANIKAKQNSKRCLTMGNWNVKGFSSKISEIEEYLEKKWVDICVLLETKTDEIPDPEDNYQRILFGRSS